MKELLNFIKNLILKWIENFEVDRKVPHYYNNGDGAIVMYLPVKV